jgi:hypothetical protein
LNRERFVFEDKHPTENIDVVPKGHVFLTFGGVPFCVKDDAPATSDKWIRHLKPLGAHPIGHGLDRDEVLRQIKQASPDVCIT